KRTVAFRVGRFFHRHGRDRCDVRAGLLREILGNGTLFDGADSLLGGWAKVLRVEIFHTDSPFLLAMLPPGAFIGLGLMLAVKYLIDEKF
ncbi:hypothetical protein L245_18395, partial [Salmonella enterica subsp. enterica serovar Worthington str. BCH-4719]